MGPTGQSSSSSRHQRGSYLRCQWMPTRNDSEQIKAPNTTPRPPYKSSTTPQHPLPFFPPLKRGQIDQISCRRSASVIVVSSSIQPPQQGRAAHFCPILLPMILRVYWYLSSSDSRSKSTHPYLAEDHRRPELFRPLLDAVPGSNRCRRSNFRARLAQPHLVPSSPSPKEAQNIARVDLQCTDLAGDDRKP
jgi:hypothetical protein